MYTANVSVAVTAAQDFFEVNAPSTGIVVVHRIFLGQSSDAADAQAEMLRVQIERGGGTAGSGGTTPTAAPHCVGHAAFGGTVEANNTTQVGTPTTIYEEAFNVQAGWFWVPTPEERIIIPPSGILVVAIPTAPTDSLTMQGSITFEEID
jgi:hypothetical protein